MVDTLYAQKRSSRQVWTSTGRRMVVTPLVMGGNVVVRTTGTEEAARVQIGFGEKKMKNMAQPQQKQLEKAGIAVGKRVFREVAVTAEEAATVAPGTTIAVESVLSVGDRVKVSGLIKGRGFAGVMKRHGFHGGSRTHGQSDRERAPGSIGAGTTPGHVWKKKRMAGQYGNATETLLDREVIAIDPTTQTVWFRGTLPGSINSILTVQVTGAKGSATELTAESLAALDIRPAVETVVAEETPASEAVVEAAPEVETSAEVTA